MVLQSLARDNRAKNTRATIARAHTAKVESEEARRRQDDFKSGKIHLLSSPFEVGVDLGDLEVAFLRNVPPEPFNYTQRAGVSGAAKNLAWRLPIADATRMICIIMRIRKNV